MSFEIFLATAPGLEGALYHEVRSKGFKKAKEVKGGVTIQGEWPDVWRANLWIRGVSKVLARVAKFKVLHLSHLDKRTRDVDWCSLLDPNMAFNVQVSCTKSRIYHSDAASERIARAISDDIGAPYSREASVTVMARIERDMCTLSIDTSGELLHKRGYKASVNKAPMRENMAALFLQECGYNGSEPVYDPMCGSGTFVVEAAEVAAKLNPGRERSFAFEDLVTFDSDAWQKMRSVVRDAQTDLRFYGSDRDGGAVKMSIENAERAGLGQMSEFKQCVVSDITPPCDTAGLVILNPPYGGRIGDKRKLLPLYQTLGEVLKARFTGWRVGIITTDNALAQATGLPFLPVEKSVQHGGLRINLHRTDVLC